MTSGPTAGKVVVAPDSFKGTFTAREVAEAMAAGVRRAGGEVDLCPLADGGEGTMEVLLGARGGERLRASVHDPLGRPLEAEFALLADGTAVLDVAAASGLPLVDPADRDPEVATTFGTGELIAAALAAGARRVLLAAGGSATVDGGTGAIAALRDSGGLRRARIEILCDTREPFERAVPVFAPQKGAGPAALPRLAKRLESLAEQLPKDPRGVPMTGAAGGLAGGLWATFDAELRSGAELVIAELEVPARLSVATALISGEGRLDSQSLEGKLVGTLARLCRSHHRPLFAIAGRVDLDAEASAAAGIVATKEATNLAAIAAAAEELASRHLQG